MNYGLIIGPFVSALVNCFGCRPVSMAGGLVIGVAEELSTYAWIGNEPLLDPGYKAGVAFAIVYATLGIPIARLADHGVRRTIITVDDLKHLRNEQQ